MAIASLVLYCFAKTFLLVRIFRGAELASILHMTYGEYYLFVGIIGIVACSLGFILGIRSRRSDKRRRMGIVGIVLNSIAMGGYSVYLLLFYTFH